MQWGHSIRVDGIAPDLCGRLVKVSGLQTSEAESPGMVGAHGN